MGITLESWVNTAEVDFIRPISLYRKPNLICAQVNNPIFNLSIMYGTKTTPF